MRARFQLVLFLALSPLLTAAAETWVWTGAIDADFSKPGNWSTATVPSSWADVLFGDAKQFSPTLPAALDLSSITFSSESGFSHFYTFSGTSTVTLQAGLNTTGSAKSSAEFGSLISWVLPATQTWTIANTDTVKFAGPISSNVGVTWTLAGSGMLRLTQASPSLSGPIVVTGGTLQVGHAGSLGTSTVIVESGGALASDSYSGYTIANNVTLRTGATLGTADSYTTRLTFTGTVTAADQATTIALRPEAANFFEGPFVGAMADTDVTFTGDGVAALFGTTFTNIRSITANNSAIFFNTTQSVPATGGITGVGAAYLGIGAAFTASPQTLINKITAPADFVGFIGFDTDNRTESAPNLFTGTIDLSAFTNTGFGGLGSATHANIGSGATLTFVGPYKFGGGGGRLTVGPNLANAVGLIVDSPASDPLTLVLTGNNTFTGDITVKHSYLVFDAADALPSASQAIKLDNSGYVSGTDQWGGSTANLLSRIVLTNGDPNLPPIVGFDTRGPASYARTVSDAIDLSPLPGLYVGTTTFGNKDDSENPTTPGLTLTGAFTVAADQPLRLAGVNGGRLNVTSALGPTTASSTVTKLEIGHPDDAIGDRGTVVLSGDNTYTGGTMLRNGTLVVAQSGNSTPLGTGTLTVDTNTDSTHPATASLLPADGTVVELINSLFLEANAYLLLGNPSLSSGSGLILNGNLSGSGTLQFVGPSDRPTETVTTLNGNSTRTGNTYVYSTVVNANTDTALKSASLFLSNAQLNFSTIAPVVGSLGGYGANTLTFTAANATLTIDQAMENKFDGTFVGTGLSLYKTGTGTLWLTTNNELNGDLMIGAGRLGLGGGDLANRNAYIGNVASQTGRLTVANGSLWSTIGYAKVGEVGSGHLEVSNGGSAEIGGVLYIGYGAGSTGEVWATGPGSTVTAASLEIGKNGSSAGLEVSNGASVTISGQAKLLGPTAWLTIGEGGAAGSFSAAGGLVNQGELAFFSSDAIGFNTVISGAGSIEKLGTGVLTLSGDNASFAGEISILGGGVTFSTDTAAGTGPLFLGSSLDLSETTIYGSAAFTSATPQIGSLHGLSDSNAITLGAGTQLTINQASDGEFAGTISGSGASLVVKGPNPSTPAVLELGGTNTYTGGTTISGGAILFAADDGALGPSGAVTINGGSLITAEGVTLTFNATTDLLTFSNGRLGGLGTFAFDTASLTIGPDMTLAPGTLVPGQLDFVLTTGATLTFDSGGTYQWELKNAADAVTGWDSVTIAGTLNIAATSSSPFTLKIASAGGVNALNFDSAAAASWTLVSATSIMNFDAEKFVLDSSAFLNAPGGLFSVTLQGGTNLLLNYTPAAIPEPSTWALLITGLAVVGVGALRRRQRR